MKKLSIKTDLSELIAILGHKKHEKFWDTRAAEIEDLLKRGANPNAGRWAPLSLAVEMNHLEIVKVLLKYGADVNGNREHKTPIVAAADKPKILSLLKKHGAKENIFSATSEGNIKKVKALVKKNPQLIHLKDEDGCTPLYISSNNFDLETMEYFLKAGANPNEIAEESYGRAPIHLIGGSDNTDNALEAVTLLVKHKANIDAQNKGGVTALHMAVRNRNVSIVKALLKKKANPNIEDKGGKSTPLRRAVANTGKPDTAGKMDDAIEIADLLLKAGADPHHVNAAKKTMLESTRNNKIADLLKRAMG